MDRHPSSADREPRACLVRAPIHHRVQREQFFALGRALTPAGIKLFGVGDTTGVPSREQWDEPEGCFRLIGFRKSLAFLQLGLKGDDAERLPLGELLEQKRMRESFYFREAKGRLLGTRASGPEEKLRAGLALQLWHVFLQTLQPQVVLVWNGWRLPNAALAVTARELGCEVLYLERGPLPDTLQVDPVGVNGASTFAAEPFPDDAANLSPSAEAELDAYVAQLRKSGASGWDQPDRETSRSLRERLGIPGHARVLFFPGQVTIDTNIVLLSPHFEGNAEVVGFLAEVLEQHPDWWLVVKPHPRAIDEIHPPLSIGRRCIVCRDAHIHDLIGLTELVVTINSSVAVESALLGKPVLQLGTGLLSNKGVVYEGGNRSQAEELLHKLLAGDAPPIAEPRRRAFLHKLVFDFLYRFDEPAREKDAARLARRITALADRAHFESRPAEAFRSMCALFPPNLTRARMIEMFSGRELLGTLRRRLTRGLLGTR